MCSCVSVIALPTPQGNCTSVMRGFGVTQYFGQHVSHAIHSLSVQDLQKFEADITENNKVPTINRDLTAEEAVFGYAPSLTEYNTDGFISEGNVLFDSQLLNTKYSLHQIKSNLVFIYYSRPLLIVETHYY